jgi:hypothetical protein
MQSELPIAVYTEKRPSFSSIRYPLLIIYAGLLFLLVYWGNNVPIISVLSHIIGVFLLVPLLFLIALRDVRFVTLNETISLYSSSLHFENIARSQDISFDEMASVELEYSPNFLKSFMQSMSPRHTGYRTQYPIIAWLKIYFKDKVGKETWFQTDNPRYVYVGGYATTDLRDMLAHMHNAGVSMDGLALKVAQGDTHAIDEVWAQYEKRMLLISHICVGIILGVVFLFLIPSFLYMTYVLK